MNFFPFQELPLELQSYILEKCDYTSLYNLSLISKEMKENIEKDEWLWKLKTKKVFGSLFSIIKNENWIKTYQNYILKSQNELFANIKIKNSKKALKILSADKDIIFTQNFLQDCFEQSCKNSLYSVIKKLVEIGVNVNTIMEGGYTSLMWSSRLGNIDIVKYLIIKGVNINKKNKYGYTALMWAVDKNHHDIVNILINAGADINICNVYEENSFSKALKCGHFNIAQSLLESKADINS